MSFLGNPMRQFPRQLDGHRGRSLVDQCQQLLVVPLGVEAGNVLCGRQRARQKLRACQTDCSR